MNRPITIVIFFFTLLSCSQSNNLKTDKLFTEYFNKVEISGLELILAFFDKIVINKTGVENTNIVYQRYFQTISNDTLITKNHIDILRSFDIDSTQQAKLYDEITEETKSKIWCLCIMQEKNGENSFEMNPNGSYGKVFKQMKNKNVYLNSYYEGIVHAGVSTPSALTNLIYNIDDLNFRNESIRLIVAIHLLTINTQDKRIK